MDDVQFRGRNIGARDLGRGRGPPCARTGGAVRAAMRPCKAHSRTPAKGKLCEMRLSSRLSGRFLVAHAQIAPPRRLPQRKAEPPRWVIPHFLSVMDTTSRAAGTRDRVRKDPNAIEFLEGVQRDATPRKPPPTITTTRVAGNLWTTRP
jgi:hypothetical protein